MKKRSGFTVMARLIRLVKPLSGYMVLAILMGLVGHLCAAFITIFGGFAVLDLLGFATPVALKTTFVCVLLFALVRGIFRYAEQSCNHFIAFKLLALIRDKVFRALRRLCPAKLEGRDCGDLISVITSRRSCNTGMRFRTESGALSAFVLDSLRGLNETIQYDRGAERRAEMDARTDALSKEEAKLKRLTGQNMGITNTAILLFDLAMLVSSAALVQRGELTFDGALIAVLALFSSFGPTVALANLGATLQNTFAAGNRVLDILDEEPVVDEVTGQKEVEFTGAEAEHVTFSYGGEDILSDVSVRFPEGSVVGIVGRSGSGKSTLAKTFNAVLLPSGGKVYVEGMDTMDESLLLEIRRRVGMVFQNPDNQIVANVVEEDVAFAPENLGVPSAEIRKRVDDALEAVGMTQFVKHAPHLLSGGQKQRIAIAGVLAMKPECIVLDEATAMLDPIGRREVLAAVEKLNREQGITVVLITHHMNEAEHADRVIVMNDGEVAMDGMPRQVFSQVERLHELGLAAPDTVELLYRLRRDGVDVPLENLTVDECADTICRAFGEAEGK